MAYTSPTNLARRQSLINSLRQGPSGGYQRGPLGALAQGLNAYTAANQGSQINQAEIENKRIDSADMDTFLNTLSPEYKAEEARDALTQNSYNTNNVPAAMRTQPMQPPQYQGSPTVEALRAKLAIDTALARSGVGMKYGNSPVYGVDEQGNTRAYQINNQGLPVEEVVMPHGVRLTNPNTNPNDMRAQKDAIYGAENANIPIISRLKRLEKALDDTSAAKSELENQETLSLAEAERIKSEDAAKAYSAAMVDLDEYQAFLPRLQEVVTKLKRLGETASYTLFDQGVDFYKEQTKQDPSQGRIDREGYISTVANEVLPLLRKTFGAAFTAAEGESLKVTLGDPDTSSKVKNAALDSFIEQKIGQIKTRAIQTMPIFEGLDIDTWINMSPDDRREFSADEPNNFMLKGE